MALKFITILRKFSPFYVSYSPFYASLPLYISFFSTILRKFYTIYLLTYLYGVKRQCSRKNHLFISSTQCLLSDRRCPTNCDSRAGALYMRCRADGSSARCNGRSVTPHPFSLKCPLAGPR